MNADAAEEDRLAIQKDLRAAGLDGAEADVVGEGVVSSLQGDLVELGICGRPEGEFLRGERIGGAAVGAVVTCASMWSSGIETVTGVGPARALDVDIALDGRAACAVEVEIVVIDKALGTW